MIYCTKHNYFHSGAKCQKCLDGEEPYLRTRDEVADPEEWRNFTREGWVK